MYHYFYKITNKLNNHYYYGIHSTDNLNDGYMGSGRKLRRAINKYGIENFEKEIIKFFETREECAKYEQLIVNEDLIKDTACYNIALGGEQTCCKGTAPVVENESGICIRVPIEDKYKDEYSSLNAGFVTVIDKTTNTAVRITTGYKFTEEQKQKLRNKFKEIGHNKGEKNSQYGTKWISKDGIKMKIKKEQLDEYLNNGWHLGMK